MTGSGMGLEWDRLFWKHNSFPVASIEKRQKTAALQNVAVLMTAFRTRLRFGVLLHRLLVVIGS